MGTINYNTSDYITMGIKPLDRSDFSEEILEEYEQDGRDIYEYISDLHEANYINTKAIIDKYSFAFYDVKLEYGYYEGYYLMISNNCGGYYDDYHDKKAAQKEITLIKKLLLELADNGLVACYPFWCTRYEDWDGTIKAIREAIKEMRSEAKSTPTWNFFYKHEYAAQT